MFLSIRILGEKSYNLEVLQKDTLLVGYFVLSVISVVLYLIFKISWKNFFPAFKENVKNRTCLFIILTLCVTIASFQDKMLYILLPLFIGFVCILIINTKPTQMEQLFSQNNEDEDKNLQQQQQQQIIQQPQQQQQQQAAQLQPQQIQNNQKQQIMPPQNNQNLQKQNQQNFFFIFTDNEEWWRSIWKNLSVSTFENVLYLYRDLLHFVLTLCHILAVKVLLFFLLSLLKKTVLKKIIQNLKVLSIIIGLSVTIAIFLGNCQILLPEANPQNQKKQYVFFPEVFIDLYRQYQQPKENVFSKNNITEYVMYSLENLFDIAFSIFACIKIINLSKLYYFQHKKIGQINRNIGEIPLEKIPEILKL